MGLPELFGCIQSNVDPQQTGTQLEIQNPVETHSIKCMALSSEYFNSLNHTPNSSIKQTNEHFDLILLN